MAVFNPAGDSSIHADFAQPETFRQIAAIYRQTDVTIVSIGVQTFTGNHDEERWFECASIGGAKHISAHFEVDSYQEAIPRVRDWSEKYGVQVGIHCHGGYSFGGQPDVVAHLLKLGGPKMGLVLDTAWAMQIGPEHGNPIQWIKRFAGQITAVHLKDFIFERDGSWTEVILGLGNLKLPEFFAALDASGFNGLTLVEHEADPLNPLPALARCVESVRANQVEAGLRLAV